MKRFVAAMLGSLAGIWISMILLSIMFFIFIGVIVASNEDATVVKENSVLHINLQNEIVERKLNNQLAEELFGDESTNLALNTLLKSINDASVDDKIKGIYLDCNMSTAGFATREAIFDALMQFKESGKWIVAYADNYLQGDYYLASVADSIYLNPVGSVDIHGVEATTLFFKGLLDKVGVEMQIVKVGTYKSAVEPFILTKMSEASAEQQCHYINRIWKSISEDISFARGVTVKEINNWADSMIITAEPDYYLRNNIVDALAYRHEVESQMKAMLDIDEDDDLNLVTPSQYSKSDIPVELDSDKPEIAVLYAVGDIVDNGNQGIVGSKMAPEILKLADDDDVKALVLRVNSGGGSAFASEQIWEALEVFKSKGKKFYVSMGDYAASGGYYISCGADKIFAEPTTLTGSIGIFGMIPCAKELMNDKLGITTGTVSSNRIGMSFTEPMTSFQRSKMQSMINRGYETFVSRCAQGRNVTTDDIKKIAEGRVWDGTTALEIGLVDELGGLDMAIIQLAKQLNLDKFEIVEYPKNNDDIWAQIMSMNTMSIKNNIIESELNDAAVYYNAVKNIKELAPVQCRMETVILK